MPDPWTETLMDDGYQDMHHVMQALRAVEFDGAIIPDHIPDIIGGSRAGIAYSIGLYAGVGTGRQQRKRRSGIAVSRVDFAQDSP